MIWRGRFAYKLCSFRHFVVCAYRVSLCIWNVSHHMRKCLHMCTVACSIDRFLITLASLHFSGPIIQRIPSDFGPQLNSLCYPSAALNLSVILIPLITDWLRLSRASWSDRLNNYVAITFKKDGSCSGFWLENHKTKLTPKERLKIVRFQHFHFIWIRCLLAAIVRDLSTPADSFFRAGNEAKVVPLNTLLQSGNSSCSNFFVRFYPWKFFSQRRIIAYGQPGSCRQKVLCNCAWLLPFPLICLFLFHPFVWEVNLFCFARFCL